MKRNALVNAPPVYNVQNVNQIQGFQMPIESLASPTSVERLSDTLALAEDMGRLKQMSNGAAIMLTLLGMFYQAQTEMKTAFVQKLNADARFVSLGITADQCDTIYNHFVELVAEGVTKTGLPTITEQDKANLGLNAATFKDGFAFIDLVMTANGSSTQVDQHDNYQSLLSRVASAATSSTSSSRQQSDTYRTAVSNVRYAGQMSSSELAAFKTLPIYRQCRSLPAVGKRVAAVYNGAVSALLKMSSRSSTSEAFKDVPRELVDLYITTVSWMICEQMSPLVHMTRLLPLPLIDMFETVVKNGLQVKNPAGLPDIPALASIKKQWGPEIEQPDKVTAALLERERNRFAQDWD